MYGANVTEADIDFLKNSNIRKGIYSRNKAEVSINILSITKLHRFIYLHVKH